MVIYRQINYSIITLYYCKKSESTPKSVENKVYIIIIILINGYKLSQKKNKFYLFFNLLFYLPSTFTVYDIFSLMHNDPYFRLILIFTTKYI